MEVKEMLIYIAKTGGYPGSRQGGRQLWARPGVPNWEGAGPKIIINWLDFAPSPHETDRPCQTPPQIWFESKASRLGTTHN